MGRGINKLSVKFVERGDLEPGLYGDGGGLYLQVSPGTDGNTKAWVYRFMMQGRARKMGLGEAALVKLADARKKAYAARLLVGDGIDPIEDRNARKSLLAIQDAKSRTFKECADLYIENNQSGWKSPKHAGQWQATLVTYAYPKIGHLPVASIDTALVMEVLTQKIKKDGKEIGNFWNTKTETAARVRGRIETVLAWAKASGYRTGENPAQWRGHLDQLLPAKSAVAPIEHHAALPYKQLPAFMAKLRQREGVSARALEFTILTAARTADTIGAKWREIDLDEKLWTVPASRLKGKKGKRKSDHVVPLCERAEAILAGLSQEPAHVFPGRSEGQGLSNMAMAELLKEMGYSGDDATVHGFRSTFKDWCSEQTAYPNEMSELALAHIVSDKVEAAYRRGDMREKRRRMMADWAAFCEGKSVGGDNVVKLRSA